MCLFGTIAGSTEKSGYESAVCQNDRLIPDAK